MGNFHTRSVTRTKSKHEDDRAAIIRHENEVRQRALRQYGILVPPMFGIPTTTEATTTTTTSTTLPSILFNTTAMTTTGSCEVTSPRLFGYVDTLRTQSDISYRLLHNHFQSGLWITSFTNHKNSIRVGIFDNNQNNDINHLHANTMTTTSMKRFNTMSSSSSSSDGSSSNETEDSDDTTLQRQQRRLEKSQNINSNNYMGGQVTLERQFIDGQNNNYGSIHCHTDPTNPLLPYTLQFIYRPIPSFISLFAVFTSSMSSPSQKQTPNTNGYIGAEIHHTIPLNSSTAYLNHQAYTNNSGSSSSSSSIYKDSNDHGTGVEYVTRTNPGLDDDNNVMHCNVGVYVPIQWDNVIDTLDTMVFNSTTKNDTKAQHLIPFTLNEQAPKSLLSQMLSSTNELSGCASIRLLGATAAIQGSMPISIHNNDVSSNNEQYKTSSYFTTSMNDDATNLSPIQLTIQQQNQFGPTNTTSNSSVSVSQMIAFQRYHLNIFDNYIEPYVHNTLAWTIQMESLSSSDTSLVNNNYSTIAEDSGEHYNNNNNKVTNYDTPMNRTNRVSLGLAWQMNRNVAFKAVLYPQSASNNNTNNNNGITATTAILLKRWYYPRITCSIIHKWKFDNDSIKHSRICPAVAQFAGIGIDIETGDNYRHNYHASSHNNDNDNNTDESQVDDSLSNKQPPTIRVLPKELYKLKQATTHGTKYPTKRWILPKERFMN